MALNQRDHRDTKTNYCFYWRQYRIFWKHKINHIGQWEGGLLIKKAENHGFIRLLIFEGLAPSSDEPQHNSSSIQKASIQH